MEESRKRKSTIPMGVFSQAIDQSLDQPTEREEAVHQGVGGIASDATEKRAVLDVSLDRSESERETADFFIVEESDATLLDQDVSATDINSDKSVEETKGDETREPANALASETALHDGGPSVEDGDPLEVIAEKIDRFSVRAAAPSSEGEASNADVDSADGSWEKRQSIDVATDLGNAMKALFDNRKESQWEDFIRVEEEADTSDQREEGDASDGDAVVDVECAQSPLVPDPVQIPIEASATAEPLIVVEPSDIEPISSIAPLETNDAPRPGLPLIRGGVAGAAAAIVLLAATTWAVIESRGNQPLTQQIEGSASTAKPMVQAEVLPSVTPRLPGPDTHVDRQSRRPGDLNDLEQQTDRPKKPKIERLSRRSKRAAKSNRRDEPQTQTAPTPQTESVSAEGEPIDAVQQPIVPPEPLPLAPSRDAIFTTLTSLRSQVLHCVEHKAGVAELDINIKGSGRVSHVVVNGDFRGTKQGSCIARVVRKARFKPFKQPEFRVLFPYAF